MERTVTIRTELESILVEQALAMARELELVSDAAPDGQVLAVSELAAIRAGRELTRRALQATLQRQAESAEKKGLPGAPARVAAVAASKTRRPRRR
jgi:hypothetical protein